MSIWTTFCESPFFTPDSRLYWQTYHFGLQGEDFHFSTPSGTIHTLTIQPVNRDILGHVIYFHPATMNLTAHLPQVSFFCEAGYAVDLIDPPGFGQSSGNASFEAIDSVLSALAPQMLETVLGTTPFVLFGQGVGCDLALTFHRYLERRTNGLILESPYASRRTWLLDKYGPGIGHLLVKGLRYTELTLDAQLRELTTPLYVVYPQKNTFLHGAEKDRVISALPSHAKCETAQGCTFLNIFPPRDRGYQARAVALLQQWMAKAK